MRGGAGRWSRPRGPRLTRGVASLAVLGAVVGMSPADAAVSQSFRFVVVGDTQTDGGETSVNWDVLPRGPRGVHRSVALRQSAHVDEAADPPLALEERGVAVPELDPVPGAGLHVGDDVRD